VADIGGKVSSLLGTFTLISGVLLPLSARQCMYVNSKYVLCLLCYYSLETLVLWAQEQTADICHNKVSLTLRCVIPVVCVTNEREESVVNQHN